MAQITLVDATRLPQSVVERLEKLPEWWSGKAWYHREAARECMEKHQPRAADHHLTISREYQAKAAGMRGPSVLPPNDVATRN